MGTSDLMTAQFRVTFSDGCVLHVGAANWGQAYSLAEVWRKWLGETDALNHTIVLIHYAQAGSEIPDGQVVYDAQTQEQKDAVADSLWRKP